MHGTVALVPGDVAPPRTSNPLTVVAPSLAAVAAASKVLALLGPRSAPSAARRVSASTPAALRPGDNVNEFGGAEMASVLKDELSSEVVLDPGRFRKGLCRDPSR